MSDHPIELFDVNVLTALTLPAHVHHERALAHFRVTPAWATCAITEVGWLRLLMNPVVSGRTVSAVEALRAIASFRARPEWSLLGDAVSLSTPHVDVSVLVGSKQVTDFHLLELVARSGARLATFDVRLQEALAPTDREHVLVIT